MLAKCRCAASASFCGVLAFAPIQTCLLSIDCLLFSTWFGLCFGAMVLLLAAGPGRLVAADSVRFGCAFTCFSTLLRSATAPPGGVGGRIRWVVLGWIICAATCDCTGGCAGCFCRLLSLRARLTGRGVAGDAGSSGGCGSDILADASASIRAKSCDSKTKARACQVSEDNRESEIVHQRLESIAN